MQQRRSENDDRPRRRAEDDRPRRHLLAPREAARLGLEEVAELTGYETQGVVSVERDGDGWVVGVEVVEDHRVPSTADVLALYEARIDENGDLAGYTRTRRYPRGRTDSGEGAR